MRSVVVPPLLILCICFAIPAESLAHAPSHARNRPVEPVAFTITVSTNVDELTANGACSLREAILAANTGVAVDACPGGAGPATILLSTGTYSLTLVGAGEDAGRSGDLDIKADLTVVGAGVAVTTITGNYNDRIFDIRQGNVTLTDLRIENGAASSGAGIYNSVELRISNVVVTGNYASGSFNVGGGGGGILNTGTLTITNSTITQNKTTGCGFSRGCYARVSSGGGIYNTGILTVINSLIDSNVSDFDGLGAGIYNGNTAVTVITNSTVSNNHADDAWPESIPIAGIANWGLLTLANTTVADNEPRGVANFGHLRVTNTLLARNTESDCSGALSSGGYNLIQDLVDASFASCALANNLEGNLLRVEGGLDTRGLQDNGGPTYTLALLPSSKAIDAGSPAAPGMESACATTDQRMAPRPSDGNADGIARCDIGAYELQLPAPPVRRVYLPLMTNTN